MKTMHLDQAAHQRLVDGTLLPEEISAAEEHLRSCRDCASFALASFDQADSTRRNVTLALLKSLSEHTQKRDSVLKDDASLSHANHFVQAAASLAQGGRVTLASLASSKPYVTHLRPRAAAAADNHPTPLAVLSPGLGSDGNGAAFHFPDPAILPDVLGRFATGLRRGASDCFQRWNQLAATTVSLSSATVIGGYYLGGGTIDLERVISLLNTGAVPLRELAEAASIRVLVAEISSEQLPAMLTQPGFFLRDRNETYIAVIRQDSPTSDKCGRFLAHEIEELSRNLHHQGRVETSMQEQHTTTSMNQAFASLQLNVHLDEKTMLAEWNDLHLPLSDGGGAVIDAGTSAFVQFQLLLKRVTDGNLRFPAVLTNNLFVLEEWLRNKGGHNVNTVRLRFYGDTADPEHMAFFGGNVEATLNAATYSPTNVYIGVSGIDFDGKDAICGYHGGEEQVIKELLFSRSCKRRIILATHEKIGETGASVFHVRGIQKLDRSSPIYLVTDRPEKNSDVEQRFLATFGRFKETREAMAKDGIQFHWVTVERNKEEGENKGNVQAVEEMTWPPLR